MTADAGFPLGWLRSCAPYINTHRGRTFVVWFSGETLQSERFANLVHDLTLLSHLGVRLVLVHGMRPQIDDFLRSAGKKPRFEGTTRVTDTDALLALLSTAGHARSSIEAAFSTGLPNTPMSGAQISLCSGNLVTAQPYGIRGGIDFAHTGEVRRIRERTITQLLEQGSIVLLTPIGYSPTGDIFNLHTGQVAARTAIALKADKLIYLHEVSPTTDSNAYRGELSLKQAVDCLDNPTAALSAITHLLEPCVQACQQGVTRCHLLNASEDGVLLRELLTRDGSGLMLDSGTYDVIRTASHHDVQGIYRLITPLIEEDILLPRSASDLERSIDRYYVAERDGSIIACASLTLYGDQAEIGCLAVHPDFRASGKAAQMLKHLSNVARSRQCRQLFALSTRSGDWFLQQGFLLSSSEVLPEQHSTATAQHGTTPRGSRVFTRAL